MHMRILPFKHSGSILYNVSYPVIHSFYIKVYLRQSVSHICWNFTHNIIVFIAKTDQLLVIFRIWHSICQGIMMHVSLWPKDERNG